MALRPTRHPAGKRAYPLRASRRRAPRAGRGRGLQPIRGREAGNPIVGGRSATTTASGRRDPSHNRRLDDNRVAHSETGSLVRAAPPVEEPSGRRHQAGPSADQMTGRIVRDHRTPDDATRPAVRPRRLIEPPRPGRVYPVVGGRGEVAAKTPTATRHTTGDAGICPCRPSWKRQLTGSAPPPDESSQTPNRPQTVPREPQDGRAFRLGLGCRSGWRSAATSRAEPRQGSDQMHATIRSYTDSSVQTCWRVIGRMWRR